jgi:predicted nucleic-acid-binding protein
VRAVDTNVLARYYLADDPAQARVAKGVLEAGGVFVPKTVMLELAWVLKSVAGQPARKALQCLRHLAALPGVIVEDAEEVQAALELCAQGLEFADALHLCASSACVEMLTFDDRFVRRAAKAKPKTPVARPSSRSQREKEAP